MSECQSLLTIASHFQNLSTNMFDDICRMCLQRGEKSHFISLDFGQPSIKSKLSVFMPELNLEIVDGPVICGPCSAALENAYQLKIKCLQSDGKIWSRIHAALEFGPTITPVKLISLMQPHETNQREEITVEPNFNYYQPYNTYNSTLYQNLDGGGVNKSEAHSTTSPAKDEASAMKIGDLFVCTTCKETFESKDKLHEHIPKHFGKRPFMCSYCYKCFTLKSNLQIHMRTHTKIRPYNCDYCKKGFTTKGNLKTHVRVHTKEKPYVCTICDKSFIQKVQLNTHLLLHEDDQMFACDVCKKTFCSKYTLLVHKRIHEDVKPFVCEHCDKCFTTNGNLSVHMRKHTGEKPYKCDECDKGFSQAGQLKIHNKKLHNSEIDVTSDDDRTIVNKQEILDGTGIPQNLDGGGVNKSEAHSTTSPAKDEASAMKIGDLFVCTTCKETFESKDKLHEHIPKHFGKRPFMCSYCCKCFTLKSNLQISKSRPIF